MDVLVGESRVNNKITPINIKYVPRSVWVDGNFVSLEERIERALNDHRFSLLLGLSGTGKSVSAEYIARCFAEMDKVVIKLIPKDIMEFKVEIVKYGDKAILHVYLSTSYLGSEERMMKLAYAISKLSKKVVKDEKRFVNKVGGILKKIFQWTKRESVKETRFGKELKKNVKEICITTDYGVEVINDVLDLANEFKLECVGVDADQTVKVVEILSDFSWKLGISSAKDIIKALKDFFPVVSVALYLVLFFIGVLEVREIFGKRSLEEEIFEKLEKAENVLIIVDDFADVENKGIMRDFLELCYKAGMRVFVVRRLDFNEALKTLKIGSENRFWGCVNLFRFDEIDTSVDKLKPLWDLNAESLKECVSIMMNASFEEFEGMVKANEKLIMEERERKGLGEIGNLEEWYRKTLGIPYLALSLMKHKRVEGVKLEGVAEYPTKPFFELSEDEAQKFTNAMILGYVELYKVLVTEDRCLIPVILQPVAEDEVNEFYNEMGWNCDANDLRYRSEVKVFERWEENVDVFDLIELNVKLREMFDLLAELDPPMNGRRIIRREILNWKWKLLEIMTNNSMKFGKSFYRMRHEALRHVEFLKKFGEKELRKIWKDFDDKKLEDYHLKLLRDCLQSEPDFGIVKAEEGLKIAKKGVFALAFLNEFAKKCRFYRRKDFALKVWNALKEFKVESEAEMAWKIIAESSVLSAVYLSAVFKCHRN
ncbi:MAG: hypothetical protein J7K36_00290 [Archaeoglobaceae archaeon]|nr:hypothetical protein [Archaeoglobaceae archaeon]